MFILCNKSILKTNNNCYNYNGDRMKKVKIIATAGPACMDKNTLREMYFNGMNVVRFNMTHSSHEFCRKVVQIINEINEEDNLHIATLFDLNGPDVRIGKFNEGKAFLTKGDKIRIYDEELIGDNTKFSVCIKNMINSATIGSIIKLDEGKIELEIIRKGSNYLVCEVLNEGFIYDNKSISIPNVRASNKFLSKKDISDIELAHELKASFIALSFVSNQDDVLEVNDLLIKMGNDNILIISKIENEAAVNHVEDIIKVSDGVMVARGDLGVELGVERVPGIQKKIVAKSHRYAKICIVATQMLASMEHEIKPTRAEVSDVANAVLDGADAVMLSGETTVGNYPVLTVRTMSQIIEAIECDIDYDKFLNVAFNNEYNDVTSMISYSVCKCANKLKAKAIVAVTKSGYTARKMSLHRPNSFILALCLDEETCKSLMLNFGVIPILVDRITELDELINVGLKKARASLEVVKKDKIILTGGYPLFNIKTTNFMKIEEI